MARRKALKRLMAALPSLCVTLSWLGLWWVWPSLLPSDPAPVRSRRVLMLPATADSESDAHRSPVVFGPPSPVGFSTRASEDREIRLLSHRAELPVRLLPRQKGEFGAVESGTMRLDLQPGYDPDLGPVSEPALADERPNEVHVLVGRELRAMRFELPDLPPELAAQTNLPWRVGARIAIDAAGRVQHVFLQMPGESPDVRLRVEHYLLRGLASPGEDGRAGWVVVDCGAP